MSRKVPFYRYCKHLGCNNLTRNLNAYCDAHRGVISNSGQGNEGKYHDLYNNAKWRKFSYQYRLNNPLCVNYDKCNNSTKLVDHIVPLRLGGLQYDTNNMQPMCHTCHNKKRNKERECLQFK